MEIEYPVTSGSIDEALASLLTRRALLIGGGAAGLATLLAACSSSSKPASQPSTSVAGNVGGAGVKNVTLKIAVATIGSQSPDPHLAANSSDNFVVLFGIGERLIRRDLNNAFVPALAEKWDVSADGLTWTFTLRDGVKMHDGSTFTANDVKTAVDRVKGPDFTHFAAFNSTKPVATVVDPLHVTISTSVPFATMLDDMPVPIPTGYYTTTGDAAFRTAPKAAGSFQFVSQQLNSGMTFSRFDQFFDSSRLANFKSLQLVIIPDESARISALQSGSVDAAHGLGPLSVQQLRGSGNIKVITQNDVGVATIGFNDLNFPGRQTPFNDMRVRQALSLAIDRQALSSSLLKGQATPTGNLWPKGTPGYDSTIGVTPYDPTKAKTLLQQAGFTSFKLNLGSKNADAIIPGVQQLGQALQAYWKAIGVDVTYSPLDPAIVSSYYKNRSWPSGAQLTSLPGNLLLDPGTAAGIILKSTGGFAVMNDPQVDALVGALQKTVQPDQRTTAAQAITKYVMGNAYTLPLFDLNGAVAIGPNVSAWPQQSAVSVAGPWWYLRAK